MERRVLIADSAAGPDEATGSVLARFGFVRSVNVPSFDAAIGLIRESHFDLIILPVEEVTGAQLIAIEREIRRDPTTSVIATAPVADSDVIVRAMRAGIHEFLVYPPKAEDLAGSVDRLMRRLSVEAQHGELIAVHSGKGGLGSTSVAVNLAYAIASQRPDSRVALADMVITGGDVRVFLNLKSAYDLSHLIAKGSQVDGELLNAVLTPVSGGVWALPTAESPEDHELFDSAAVSSILSLLRAQFSVTVVDCEHHLSEGTLATLDAANRIVLLTQLSIPALRSAQRTLAIYERLGYDSSKICVVVNRYQSGDVLPVKDAAALLQTDVYWQLPNDYQLSAASLAKGVPVGVEDPGARLSKSYGELAGKLSGVAVDKRKLHAPTSAQGSRIRRLFGAERGGRNVT